MGRALKAGLLLVAMIGGMACRSESGTSSPDPTITSTESQTVTTRSTGPTSAEDRPEVVQPDPEKRGSVESLALDDDERACVLGELGDDVDPADALVSDLDAAVNTCLRGGFGEGFADGLRENYPGLYRDSELACLADAYGALSGDDVGVLMTAGFNPREPSPDAEAILDGLFGGCGVERPPPGD